MVETPDRWKDANTAVDPAAHGTRHNPGGLDPVTTAAPDTNVTPEQANAEGDAESLARSDHMHYVPSGDPSEIAGVQAAAEGTGAAFARTDHAHAINHGITDNHIVTVDAADVATGEYAKFTADGLQSKTPTEVLADLSGQAGAAFDWNNQDLNNIKQINLTDPTELTISSGVVTVTQGFHSVDTEGDAATDNLDTINGGVIGDELYLKAAHPDRTVILRDSVGNIQLCHDDVWKSYSFRSPIGTSGTYYMAGYYAAPAADANLTQASTSVNYGTANISYAAHAFLVAGGAGSVDAGTVSIVVSGTSITDAGVRVAADSETIVADITTMSLNAYYETVKKWLGTVTYTLTPAGGAATYSADFNYGYAKYEDFGNRHLYVTDFEVVGRAGANDTGFNIILFKHSATGWTYDAAAFVPGDSGICSMNTDHDTEINLANGLPFAYKRDNLNEEISGDDSEGCIIKVITGANAAVDSMNAHIGAHATNRYRHLDSSEEMIKLVYDGSYWVEPR